MPTPSGQFDVKDRPLTGTAWLHLIIIIIVIASPFLFSWPVIILGIALYWLQIVWLGNCLLTRRQFGIKERSVTFYYYLLTKLKLTPHGYRIRFLADYIVPPIILGWAIVWQLFLDKKPLAL